MVVLMVFAACYAVLQLAFLGSVSRSVRFSTLLLVVIGGCYGCGVLALALQLTYTRLVETATGQPLSSVVQTASYTVDPLLEELVKLVPLVAILLMLRSARRQWGYVDHLLVGAAAGAGFALAEGLLRYAGRAARAVADGHGGFLVPMGLSIAQIRGPAAVLTTWLPPPVRTVGLLGGGSDLNVHVVWTALAGLGLGAVIRTSGRRRLLGLVPLLYAVMDHAAMNRSIVAGGSGLFRLLLDATGALRAALPAVVLLALVGATVLDVRAVRGVQARYPELRLAGEGVGFSSMAELWRTASLASPWTLLVVSRFVLPRRAAWRELTASPEATSPLAVAVEAAAEQLDRADRRGGWPAWSWGRLPSAALLRSARNWRLWAWLVLLVPGWLFLLIGTSPGLSWVQTLMASRSAFALLAVLTAVGVGLLGWQLVALVRRSPEVRRSGASDLVLRLVSRTAAAGGAGVAGCALVLAWLAGAQGGDRAVTNFHILDALSLLSFAAGAALILAALFLFPPLGFVALAEGGVMLVTTAAVGQFALATTTGLALGGLGVVLSEAAEGGGPKPPPARSSTGPSGFQGHRRQRGVNLDKETRSQVQQKLPAEWGDGRPTAKGIGTRWFGRNPNQNGIRVDRGQPDAELPSQRVDHVIVRHEGKVIGPDGRPVRGRIDESYESHIPLKDWLTWRFWWRP